MSTIDRNSYKYLPIIHRIVGKLIIPASFAQVGLGLYILYPFYEKSGFELWILYITMISFWIILFTFTKIYHVTKVNKKIAPTFKVMESGYNATSTELETAISKVQNKKESPQQEEFKYFSWMTSMTQI